MTFDPFVHRVYRSLNRPLTIWGVERRFFFLALVIGSAAFNFFGSLLTGFVMFVALYTFGRWVTVTDPQILRILLNSSTVRRRYDPLKGVDSVRRRHLHD
jgi:type IV secretory pathway VirB3-like protein